MGDGLKRYRILLPTALITGSFAQICMVYWISPFSLILYKQDRWQPEPKLQGRVSIG